ncbi:MAG: hypothetical protein LBT13_05040 [Treponema sp.]|jgi:hypothetical protein|nr:hypothetical protein [Treponema sp.]
MEEKMDGSPVLVLKEFKLNEKENEFLIIKGRISAGFNKQVQRLYNWQKPQQAF